MVERFYEAKETWGWEERDEIASDEYFEGWDRVPQTDPEDDEPQDALAD